MNACALLFVVHREGVDAEVLQPRRERLPGLRRGRRRRLLVVLVLRRRGLREQVRSGRGRRATIVDGEVQAFHD